jgi:hypothetical protein
MGLAAGVALSATPASGQETSAVTSTGAEESLEEISRKLDNPFTQLWSLVLQEDLILLEGDNLDGTEVANNFFFQPSLPVSLELNGTKVLFARPVFPIVTNPIPDLTSGTSQGHQTGFGDMQMLAAIGPSRLDGTVWGVGATFKFPTASKESLGAGKWQAGPSLMYFYLGRPWTLGVLAQHWWSYAGDPERAETSRTDIQYVARRQFPGAWSVGMGPTISIDWTADSGQRLTLPIGLGVTKTVRIGGTPVKLRFEPQYSLVRPDHLGTAWNIRLQIAPVISSPFAR